MSILTLKKNNDLYRHVGGVVYRNLRTGVEWNIDEPKAGEIFLLNPIATKMFNKFPNIETLIQKLNLKNEATTH